MDDPSYARAKVSGPAIVLITLSALTVGLLVLALIVDVWLIASGLAAQAGQEDSAIFVRIVWSLLMLGANGVILVGALRMKDLRSRALCQAACILALIPCLGPSFILGIPFGIWGLIVLNDPAVAQSFAG